jgi:hypothetical protein
MADPVTMAVISMGATAAGAGVGAFGSIMGGQAQAGMYQYQAGLARMNAQIQRQNAIYATQKGEAEAMQSGMKTRQQIGATLTRQAASGLDVNAGSGVAVRRSEQEIGMYDQAALRSRAAIAAYGARAQGLMDESQAVLDQFAAKNAQAAGYIGAGSSILSGIGSVSNKWLQGRQMGLWGSDSASVNTPPGAVPSADWG